MDRLIEFLRTIQTGEDNSGAELADILAIPDSIFNIVAPQIMADMKTQGVDIQIRQMALTSLSQEEKKNFVENWLLIFETLPEGKKKEFLQSVFDPAIEALSAETLYDALVHIQTLDVNALLPEYAHYGDAGADIYALEETIIKAHSRGNMVRTGIAVSIPKGWMLTIRARSGLSYKTGLRISNGVGTIDSGYLDEIKVLFDNISDEDYVIKAGDRIAQFVLEKVNVIRWEYVEDVKNIGNDRGGGFGSTDGEVK